MKLRSFKSSERIYEKGDGPYRGFGYLSLCSDPINLATWNKRALQRNCNFATFKKDSRKKDYNNPNGARYINDWLENESKPIIIF